MELRISRKDIIFLGPSIDIEMLMLSGLNTSKPPSSLAFVLSSLAALPGNSVTTDRPTMIRDELAASLVTLASVVSPLS